MHDGYLGLQIQSVCVILMVLINYRNIGHMTALQCYVIRTLLGLFRHKDVTLDVGEIL